MWMRSIVVVTAAGAFAGGGVMSAQSRKPSPFSSPATRAVATAPAAKTAAVVIPAGTILHVRLKDALSTGVSGSGDRFAATLESPLQINGRTVAPRGASLTGTVQEAESPGRIKGQARLVLALNEMEVGRRHVPLKTSSQLWEGGSPGKRKWNWLGAGALAGAISGKKQVRLPAETVASFQLERSATIQP